MTGIALRLCLLLAALLATLIATPAAAAPDIIPSPRVTAAVVVRAQPTTGSEALAVNEFLSRGTVWRTDFDDPNCLTDAAKIGPDNDNRPGGCDNILVRVPPSGPLLINYERIHD
jgi:hypothetical protein